LSGQGVEFIKANYTKYEYRVPMRDGVRLFTSVYVPKDTSEKWPMMMSRTPYSIAPYGADQYRAALGPSEKFAREKFIFVYQDVRGRYQSEGKWIEMTPHKPQKAGPADIDESTDTYDTVDWLVKNVPNNSGRLGTWGISYPGFYAAAGMIDAHPAHKAASPQAPVTDLYMGDDTYHNGALMLAANFGFYLAFKPHPEPTLPEDFRRGPFKGQDGYDNYLRGGTLTQLTERYYKEANPYWLSAIRNTTYSEFWKSRNISAHMKSIRPAVLTVGGWFDAEDAMGPNLIYGMIQRNNPPAAGNHLVLGPWTHGQWARGEGDKVGDVSFAVKTSAWYRDNIEYPFFQFHLKQKGDGKFPAAWAFETGTNVWRTYDVWPPKEAQAKKLYFHPGGKLSFDPPAEADAADEYLADPNKPVPFVGYITPGMASTYMTSDQRHAARRPDVLVYETDPLEEDVTVAGPVGTELFFSTTGTDADYVVKLVDAYPSDYPNPEPNPGGVQMGGYQQLVRGEPFRAKFRNGFEKPEALTPNKRDRVAFEMPGVLHTFRRGHRIMVHVQSSWFPLVDRNPQKFVEIPEAKPADFQRATHRILRAKGAASHVTVGVLR
jgi:putative CocE/NonD family hydrolase